MINFLLIMTIVLTVVLIVGFMMLHRMLSVTTKELQKLGQKMDHLEVKVSENEKELAAIKAEMSKGGGEPWGDLVSIALDFRKKGLVPTLTALGSRLFRSYFKHKRGVKALPAPKKGKK